MIPWDWFFYNRNMIRIMSAYFGSIDTYIMNNIFLHIFLFDDEFDLIVFIFYCLFLIWLFRLVLGVWNRWMFLWFLWLILYLNSRVPFEWCLKLFDDVKLVLFNSNLNPTHQFFNSNVRFNLHFISQIGFGKWLNDASINGELFECRYDSRQANEVKPHLSIRDCPLAWLFR